MRCEENDERWFDYLSGELSEQETAAVVEFVVGQAFVGWDFGGVAASQSPAVRQAGVPITIDYNVTVTAPCPEGGEVSVAASIAGTIDDQTESGTLSMSVTSSLSSCAFSEDGVMITINTNPDLVLAGALNWENGNPVGTQVFTYTGGFSWSTSDGREGSCTIDLLVEQAEDGSTVESGTICGETIGDGV